MDRARKQPSAGPFDLHEFLLIGISDYEREAEISNHLGSIRHAHEDAIKLEHTLYDLGYPESRVHCLLNEEAKLEVIRSKIEQIRHQRVRPNMLMIFWAGHGLSDPNGVNYLLPWDVDLEELDTTALTMENLAELSVHSHVANLALFLDTCHAKPNPRMLFRPGWSHSAPALADRVRLFVGASTYQARDAPAGGLVTRCLIDGLTDSESRLTATNEFVDLDDLADFLRWELRIRAAQLDLHLESPNTFYFRPSRPPSVGRNLRKFVESHLAASTLPKSVDQLARRVARLHWPKKGQAGNRVIAVLKPVEELAPKLLLFAHGKIAAKEYSRLHNVAVTRALLALGAEPVVGPFLPKLLDHCLAPDGVGFEKIVRMTYDQILEGGSYDVYVDRISLAFCILDQLNSVPWAYGIKTRAVGGSRGAFSPIIDAKKPIDPKKNFSRRFRTTTEHQEFARLELLTGPEKAPDIWRCQRQFWHRVRLPENLPRGQEIVVRLKRRGEKVLELRLGLPTSEGAKIKWWWWVRTSDGFERLASDAARKARESFQYDDSGKSLQLLLELCKKFLNQRWYTLQEEDGERMVRWAQQTSRALVRHDQESLRAALTLLIEDLRRSRNASMVFVLESVLATTSAPSEVTNEFARLAEELLLTGARFQALQEAWVLVEQWRRHWKSQDSGDEGENGLAIEMLFSLLGVLRDVILLQMEREEPQELVVPANLFDSLKAAVKTIRAASGRRVKTPYEASIVQFEQWLATEAVGRSYGASFRKNPARILQTFFFDSAEYLLDLAGASKAELAKFRKVVFDLRHGIQVYEQKADMARLVSDWYEQWSLGEGESRDPEAIIQTEVLIELLGALEKPETTDEVVARILLQKPLQTEVFREWMEDLSLSKTFIHLSTGAQEALREDLQVFDHLGARWRQEAEFYRHGFQTLASKVSRSPLEKSGDSAERDEMAAELWRDMKQLANIRLSEPELLERPSEELDPEDARELLEEMPVESAAEGTGVAS